MYQFHYPTQSLKGFRTVIINKTKHWWQSVRGSWKLEGGGGKGSPRNNKPKKTKPTKYNDVDITVYSPTHPREILHRLLPRLPCRHAHFVHVQETFNKLLLLPPPPPPPHNAHHYPCLVDTPVQVLQQHEQGRVKEVNATKAVTINDWVVCSLRFWFPRLVA